MPNTIILTKEQLELVAFDIPVGRTSEGFKVIERSPWESEGKYEYQEVIFEYDNKFYSLGHCRSGSYFTEYSSDITEGYHDGEATEVKQEQVVVTKWVTV